jgi:hypothetical protein
MSDIRARKHAAVTPPRGCADARQPLAFEALIYEGDDSLTGLLNERFVCVFQGMQSYREGFHSFIIDRE